MKELVITIALIFIITTTCTLSTYAQISNVDSKISGLILSYEKALNASNTEDVLQLFSEDGILVLQGSPTRIGTEAVKEFFNSIFKRIDFNTKFNIEEIVHISSEWAFVRTTTRSNNSTDSSEGGHEIFILKKQAGRNWKIARYAGSSSK